MLLSPLPQLLDTPLTIWQFISFTLVMAGALFGTLAWISTSL
jgi:hypothetical protein